MTRVDVECTSDMLSGDAHDELASSMDVVVAAQAQVAEREQQRERVSVGCAMRDGDGAGGSGNEAARALEGDCDGVRYCEGVDGAEQGTSTAAREAEGDDEDEAMVGDENVSAQRTEGGSSSTGGIVKRKRNRCKRLSSGQRQELTRRDRRLAADEASGS